jgi:hypothetical protein
LISSPTSNMSAAMEENLAQAASRLVAEAIRLDLGIRTRCPSLGGLTGISAAAEAEPDEPPDIVAFVSVGAVTSPQLDLLLRRIRATFPQSQVVIGYWDEPALPPQAEDVDQSVRYAETAGSLIDVVGRIADGMTHKAGLPSDSAETTRRPLQLAHGV